MDNHSGDFANLEIWGLCKVIPHLVLCFKKAAGRYSPQRVFAAMAIEDKILNLLKEPLEKGRIRPRQALAPFIGQYDSPQIGG